LKAIYQVQMRVCQCEGGGRIGCQCLSISVCKCQRFRFKIFKLQSILPCTDGCYTNSCFCFLHVYFIFDQCLVNSQLHCIQQNILRWNLWNVSEILWLQLRPTNYYFFVTYTRQILPIKFILGGLFPGLQVIIGS